MEGKPRKANKFALFTAGCAAALLVFAVQPRQTAAAPVCPSTGGVITDPAVCPQVAPNGVGDLLIYALWSTNEGLDTLFAVIEAFGGNQTTPPTPAGAGRFVHIRVHDGVTSA